MVQWISLSTLFMVCQGTPLLLPPGPHGLTTLTVHAGFVAAFTEGPIDFYKSQIQVQIIRAKQIPDYKRE